MADPQAGARAPPEPQADALVESVRVDGAAAEATLSDAELAWRPSGRVRDGAGRRKLELESDVLGFRVDGRALKVATFARWDEAGVGRPPSPLGCGGAGGGDRRRGEVVVEMESEEAAERWGDAMRDRFVSLGNSLVLGSSVFLFSIYSVQFHDLLPARLGRVWGLALGAIWILEDFHFCRGLRDRVSA